MTPRYASHAKGYAFVAALVLLVVVLGWRVATLIAPERNAPPAVPSVQEEPSSYLVYRTYRVVDRGSEEWANDDISAYEFRRYPLDGKGGSEKFAEGAEDNDHAYGSPWMAAIGDDLLLYARRQSSSDDVLFIDIDGHEAAFPAYKGSIWAALPSPDGKWIAASDAGNAKGTILVSTADGEVRKIVADKRSDLGVMTPLIWSHDSRTVYLRPVFEGELFISELWALDVETGKAKEVTSVRKLGLMHFTVVPSAGRVVGSIFKCDGLSDCGGGPSTLYVADLEGGKWQTVLSDDNLGYAKPLLSPDGSMIAFSYSGEDGDTWVVDVDDPGSRRLLISGAPLAWTPDGSSLVIDRDDSLQIIRLSDRHITVVAERTGKYNDPDFQGLDFIGIIRRNSSVK